MVGSDRLFARDGKARGSGGRPLSSEPLERHTSGLNTASSHFTNAYPSRVVGDGLVEGAITADHEDLVLGDGAEGLVAVTRHQSLSVSLRRISAVAAAIWLSFCSARAC